MTQLYCIIVAMGKKTSCFCYHSIPGECLPGMSVSETEAQHRAQEGEDDGGDDCQREDKSLLFHNLILLLVVISFIRLTGRIPSLQR